MPFPELEPAERAYSAAQFPITTQDGWAGGAVRFRHGTTATGATLRLGYQLLTAAEASLIRGHYQSEGGAGSFTLGTLAWAGHSSATDLVAAGTLWRYVNPPEESHRSGGLIDVAVELESVI